MGKILLIVSFVFVLLSAGLGYMGKMKLDETRQTLADSESNLTKTKGDLSKTKGDLKTANDNIASVTAEKDGLSTQLATAQGQVTEAKGQVSKLTQDIGAANTKIAESDAALQAKQQEFDAYKTAHPEGGSAAPDQNAELTAKVTELTTVNETLQGKVDALQGQVKNFEAERTARVNNQLRLGTEGKVLAVNPAWNFVVLSLGDKQGVSSNTELLVKRGRQLVGKVRVTSVEPSSSVADIVTNSVPTGVSIAPGDQVIYQSAE